MKTYKTLCSVQETVLDTYSCKYRSVESNPASSRHMCFIQRALGSSYTAAQRVQGLRRPNEEVRPKGSLGLYWMSGEDSARAARKWPLLLWIGQVLILGLNSRLIYQFILY